MKFWWSCQIPPATSPSSTSHTSIESTSSRPTTSMNGSCTETRAHTVLVCLVAFTITVLYLCFPGQRGFRRLRLRLKNSLRQKRRKGKRPIKVCHGTHTADGNRCDDLWVNSCVCVCVCLQLGLWRLVESADSSSPSWRPLNSRRVNPTVSVGRLRLRDALTVQWTKKHAVISKCLIPASCWTHRCMDT